MAYQSIHTGSDIDTGITNIQQIFDLIYPVGSYYMSSDSANPSTKFGGSWEQITDRMIMAAGSTYMAGTTGGSANHTHTSAAHTHTTAGHALTIDEMPEHTGHLDPGARPSNVQHGNPNNSAFLHYKNNISNYGNGNFNFGWIVQYGNEVYPATESRGKGVSHSHGDTGSTTPGNTGSSSNLPPYIVAYIWRRIA